MAAFDLMSLLGLSGALPAANAAMNSGPPVPNGSATDPSMMGSAPPMAYGPDPSMAMPMGGNQFQPATAAPQQGLLSGLLSGVLGTSPAPSSDATGQAAPQGFGKLFDFSDPNVAAGWQMVSNGTTQSKTPVGLFSGVGDAVKDAQLAQLSKAKMQEEKDAKTKALVAQNQTYQFLMAKDPALAAAVQSGAMTPGDAYGEYLKKQNMTAQNAQEQSTWEARQKYVHDQTVSDPSYQLDQDVKRAQLAAATARSDPYGERKAAAEAQGLKPGDPAYQSFVLTGKMPREDQAPLTTTDKKAILEADDMVATNQNAIDALKSVITPDETGKSLNDRASYGAGASTQSWLARNDPTGLFDDQKGQATTDLNNVVLGQALASLKATFGAAPTEGERQILLDLQASVDKSPAERKSIIDRGMAMAQRRLDFNKQRADQLRGGTFYKADGGTSGNAAQPSVDDLLKTYGAK